MQLSTRTDLPRHCRLSQASSPVEVPVHINDVDNPLHDSQLFALGVLFIKDSDSSDNDDHWPPGFPNKAWIVGSLTAKRDEYVQVLASFPKTYFTISVKQRSFPNLSAQWVIKILCLQLLGSTPSWSSPPGHGGFSTSTSSVPSPTVSPTQQSARRGSANTWQQISWSLTLKPPLQTYGLPWLRDQCKPELSDHFLHHPPSLQACPVKSFSARPPISCGGWANISKIKCD